MDFLLGEGVRCVSVLDVSAAAIQKARERLGDGAHTVRWIEADVTGDWHVPCVDIWHDRAVFHFLTTAGDRAKYISHLRRTVRPGGAAIIATFAEDGPRRCSGLECVRYSSDSLRLEFGDAFRLDESLRESHWTPNGAVQHFGYHRFTRTA